MSLKGERLRALAGRGRFAVQGASRASGPGLRPARRPALGLVAVSQGAAPSGSSQLLSTGIRWPSVSFHAAVGGLLCIIRESGRMCRSHYGT